MPLIKIERIVSFTSEDPLFTADNIVSRDSAKKWKCKDPGEKSISIVLQLDQPYLISSIDIGNEHSAYIEVLASRSSSPEDYKVLLVMSSFMTPLEARQSQNVNKVRMFKKQDLSEPERNEKWDKIKVVCTQPFNRHVQYGLSFINLYTSDTSVETSQQPLIGKFMVRPESPDNISAGSLFARRRELQESTSEQALKGAAAVRQATSLAYPAIKHNLKLMSPVTSQKLNTKNDKSEDKPNSLKPRNRNELLYNKDEEDKHEKIDKLIEKKSEEKIEAQKKMQKDLLSTKVQKKDIHCEMNKKKELDKTTTVDTDSKTNKANKTKNKQHKSNKRKNNDKFEQNFSKKQKHVSRKRFAQLLEDVVFVISGIQNPERASLRSMALSMGAKYRADWDNTCTHLICAFANTPKFNQVKGQGKIVKKNWLEDCYNKRKKIPWRRYVLDNADKGTESEEEIYELEGDEHWDNSTLESDTDIEMKEEGSDTEGKLQQMKKEQDTTVSIDIFQTDTDNELSSHHIPNTLNINYTFKDIFNDKVFYVDNVFEAEVEKKVKKYILAYNGILLDNIGSAVDIVITNNSNYKNLKKVFSSTVCIPPDWIWDCHNCQTFVSMEDYIFD